MDRKFYIDSVNKTVNLQFEHNTQLIKLVKKLDYNTRWNPEYRQWIIPINKYTKTKILNLVREYKFKQVAERLEEEVNVSYEQSEIDYAYLKGLCDAKGFTYIPRNYQLEALGFARDKGNIINGDDVGLGKTFESIMSVSYTHLTLPTTPYV